MSTLPPLRHKPKPRRPSHLDQAMTREQYLAMSDEDHRLLLADEYGERDDC